MAALPERQHSTVAAIYRSYEERRDSTPRAYLGASELGHACERRLWLAFRWATPKPIEGRVLRLFDTGNHEEARLVADLRAAGVTVIDRQPDGRQWAVSALGGHLRGHLDAALHGLPEAPATWAVGEFKTHNDKSFKTLVASGVRKAKPMHWAQMTVYAGLTGMDRMMYIAVNKNDDSIYTEWLHYEPTEFDRLIERARRVIFAAEPPLRISDDPAWFECKFCDFHSTCHGTDVPQASCRSCAHVTPTEAGTWRCERYTTDLTVDQQRAGCDDHRFIPILLANFAEQVGGDAHAVEYRHRATGRAIWNGAAPGYASREIAACADKAALGDAGVDALRARFEGEVVG